MSNEERDLSQASPMLRQVSASSERAALETSSNRVNKLNQVVQNFYMKAAFLIIQARQPVSPVYAKGTNTKRLNKWFNIETAETDAFREELRFWNTIDVSSATYSRTPPLTIEVVLVTRDLTANQTLVMVDHDGRKCDVDNGGARRRHSTMNIVLERWRVSWEIPAAGEPPELPVTYKKSIVVFRSLYALARILPAWKLRKKLARSKLTGNTLKILCQVVPDAPHPQSDMQIPLSQAVVQGSQHRVESQHFNKIDTAAGRLCLAVDYRTECDFRVDDSEALLSSQFLTSDQGISCRQQSSLPTDSSRRIIRPASYGPVSGSSSSSSFMRAMPSAEAGAIPGARLDRRPSATFIQPFKSPSLSASPAPDQLSNSPRYLPRTPSSVSVDRANARTAGYSHPQRIPSSLGDTQNISRPQIQAPQLVKRYSSSFGQRSGSFSGRRRVSQASESITQMEGSTHRSSSRSPSIYTPSADEQDLSEFVQLLDNRAPLVGLHFKEDTMRSSKVLSSTVHQRTHFELDRYQKLKESHIILTDSLLQPGPVKNEDRQANVRPIASPVLTYVSQASSSPGKSVSPHTPVIPSRLSESSVMPRSQFSTNPVQYTDNSRKRDKQQPPPPPPPPPSHRSEYTTHMDPNSRRLDSDLTLLSESNVTTAQTQTVERPPSTMDVSSGVQSTSDIDRDEPHAIDSASHDYDGTFPRTSSMAPSSREQTLARVPDQRHSATRRHINTPEIHCPSEQGSSSTPALPLDDDDLFFAMSDIHLGGFRPSGLSD